MKISIALKHNFDALWETYMNDGISEDEYNLRLAEMLRGTIYEPVIPVMQRYHALILSSTGAVGISMFLGSQKFVPLARTMRSLGWRYDKDYQGFIPLSIWIARNNILKYLR